MLADMDVTGVALQRGYATPASRAPTYTLPADHVAAPLIERNLPADLSDAQRSFIESVNTVYSVTHDAELFSQIIRIIMQEMRANPEFEEMLSDQDVGMMVRGMREAMGVARVQIASKKRTTTGGAKKPAKPSAKMSELENLMGSLGINIGAD